MFQLLGTSSSSSMPISRRRASLRSSSASVASTLTCRKAIRSRTTPQATCTGQSLRPRPRCCRSPSRSLASGMETRNCLIVPRLGLSCRQSQANKGLVMAMCIGSTSLRLCEPPVYTAPHPRTSPWWSKNRKKLSASLRLSRENELLCGERPFASHLEHVSPNELPHSASGSRDRHSACIAGLPSVS